MYAWEENRERCYQLYVTEAKSMDEVMELMRLRYNFTPRQVQHCFYLSPSLVPPARRPRLYSPIGVVAPGFRRSACPPRLALVAPSVPTRVEPGPPGLNPPHPAACRDHRRGNPGQKSVSFWGSCCSHSRDRRRRPNLPLPTPWFCWVGAIRLSRQCNASSPNSPSTFNPSQFLLSSLPDCDCA